MNFFEEVDTICLLQNVWCVTDSIDDDGGAAVDGRSKLAIECHTRRSTRKLSTSDVFNENFCVVAGDYCSTGSNNDIMSHDISNKNVAAVDLENANNIVDELIFDGECFC